MAKTNSVYKILAESELSAGHTSGIVPGVEIESYFGVPYKEESHLIKRIKIEFWHENKNTTIETNVNYFHSKTHNHIHLTGKIIAYCGVYLIYCVRVTFLCDYYGIGGR